MYIYIYTYIYREKIDRPNSAVADDDVEYADAPASLTMTY